MRVLEGYTLIAPPNMRVLEGYTLIAWALDSNTKGGVMQPESDLNRSKLSLT